MHIQKVQINSNIHNKFNIKNRNKIPNILSISDNNYNNKSLSFKGEYSADTLRCNDYSTFRKGHAADMTRQILGAEFVNPLNISGLTKDFDTYVNLYGVGDLHLMLMPNQDGFNNFAKCYSKDFQTTEKNIEELIKVCNMIYPTKQLYLFEAGSHAEQTKHNSRGIVPAHLHYVISQDFPSIEILKKFQEYSENEITVLEDKKLSEIYTYLMEQSKCGILGYKHISKQRKNGHYDSFLYIEKDSKVRSKSQLIPRLLSYFIYGRDDKQYYDWKKIDTNPELWSQILKQRIRTNRKNNIRFYKKLIEFNILR